VPVTTGSRRLPLHQRIALRGTTDRPVIVGGCPRSGTTLFGSMLHSHPLLAMPPETRFVVEGYKKRGDFGDLADESGRLAYAKWVVGGKGTRFRQLGLDKEPVVAALVAAPPSIGSLAGTVLSQFAAKHGKARWGDKRPKYVEILPTVFGMFPDAQFINLIRDARGCTASLKQLGWWGYGAVESLERWQRSIEAGLQARTWCRPDQYLEVRYEDLVASPVSELRRVCEFLGIDYADEMVAHESGAALIDKGYHTRVAQPVDDKAVSKWREVLTPEELSLVEDKVGDLLDEFGYPRLAGLPPVPVDLATQFDTVHDKHRSEAPSGLRRVVQPPRYNRRAAARLTVAEQRMARVALRRR
jgi:hypothetical protein